MKRPESHDLGRRRTGKSFVQLYVGDGGGSGLK